MKVIYKRSLHPLYPFDEGTETYAIKCPSSELVVHQDGNLYEEDNAHLRTFCICKVEQIVKIVLFPIFKPAKPSSGAWHSSFD